jgi:hypothetical protein
MAAVTGCQGSGGGKLVGCAAAILVKREVASKVYTKARIGRMVRHWSVEVGFMVVSLIELILWVFRGLTPSSAAVFMLWFYGIFLSGKTIKQGLKNCPLQRNGAAMAC